jgi:hypothetical protein
MRSPHETSVLGLPREPRQTLSEPFIRHAHDAGRAQIRRYDHAARE